MIGLVLLTGLAAFVGVRLALRHGAWGCGRFGRRFGHHRHWRQDDLDDGGGWRRGGRGGPRVFLRAVFSRIGARPDQEDAIRAAVDELAESLRPLRGEGRRTRHEIADALRQPSLDEVQMGEMFARHDSALESARKAVVGALAKIHETLDERQRKHLADLVAAGPRPFRGFGW